MHLNDIKFATLAGLVAIALCAVPTVARAGRQDITCPASADANQVQTRAGSTALSAPEGALQFRSAEAIFAFGSLQDAAWGELKDPTTTKKGDAVITRYGLPADADKYVICHYGDRFYQAIKLPADTKECDVVHSPDQNTANSGKTTYRISDIICR